MAGGKKKRVGGVRQVPHPAPPPPPKKKVGGVRGPAAPGAGPRTGAGALSSRPIRKVGGVKRQLVALAPPVVWPVMWKFAGVTVHQWACPFGCLPVELSQSWTHHRECRFWETPAGQRLTPFDALRAPEYRPGRAVEAGPGLERDVPLCEEGGT